jgi:hypothetical protein
MPAGPAPHGEPLEDRSTPALILPYNFYSLGNEPVSPPPYLVGVTPLAFSIPAPSSVITVPRPTPPAAGMKRVGGIVCHDADRDGVRDANEAWGAGVRLYLDMNHNGRWESSEPIRRTGPGGTYDFSDRLVVGVNQVRALVPRTWRGPLPPVNGPTVAVEPPPVLTRTTDLWPTLQIGPDGKVFFAPPTVPIQPPELTDWCRVL